MKKYLYLFLIFIVGFISWISSILLHLYDENNKTVLGINTLKSLYEFESLEQFDANINRFKFYVSKKVFNQMTADNSDRILHVYLKFQAKPCYINILEANSTYIVYSLVSESIENNRRFLFTYKIKGNKVIDIKEAELFILPTSHGWEIDTTLLPPVELPFGGE